MWVCPKKSQLPGISLWGEFGIFSAWMVCFLGGSKHIFCWGGVWWSTSPSEVEHLKINWKKWWLEGTTVHPAFLWTEERIFGVCEVTKLPSKSQNWFQLHAGVTQPMIASTGFKLLSIVAAPWFHNMANNSFRGYDKPRLMGVAHHRSF